MKRFPTSFPHERHPRGKWVKRLGYALFFLVWLVGSLAWLALVIAAARWLWLNA
jgi:hypothetical protein